MAVVDESRYKSNSYKSRAEAEKKEVQKVVKGDVQRHEKTTGEKIKESFFGEGVDNIGEHLLLDLVIPWTRDLVDILFTNAKDMILYGEVREVPSRTSRNSRRGSYVSYDDYSRRRPSSSSRDVNRRSKFDLADREYIDYDDIIAVIDEMKDVWEVYHEIAVAHYYQAIGEEVRPIDWEWGWIDIRAFTTADTYKINSRDHKTGEIEEKWILDLPKPKPLKY